MDKFDSEDIRAFSIAIEALLALFAVALSFSMGFLVGPWFGFLVLSLLSLAAVAVLAVSFMRSTREDPPSVQEGPR